ncbi:MAG: cysteine desulfurase NifS [Candidatus Margulisbacteria bacterium]|nr:cysteine desulfurase NifS [Candidatus Margulisiibacteriota bacterium]
MKRIYLDYAATTPTHPEVVAAMQPYFSEKFGNPSSLHAFGQEARSAVEQAREQVAKLINARPEEIVFTSSGTEANNFVLHGISFANKDKGNHIITSQIEHHAILEPCHFLEKQGFNATYLPVDKYGLVNPKDVEKALTDKTILVSIMHANNEIGTIQPIEEISEIIREKTYFHTDAVQTVGSIPVDVNKLGVDLLSLSGHKLYGPKGVGALYIKKGTRMESFIKGGGQERNRRASTENVPGIVGLGKAAELARKELNSRQKHLTELRDKLIKGVKNKIPEVVLNGHPELRLPKNVNLSVKYVEGESMLLNLDLEGVAASTGSACSSGSTEPSHVLKAIGLAPDLAQGSIRFSLGRLTTEDDINYVLDVFVKIVDKLRKMSPIYKGGA